jgi:electron transport complex protein RnfA
MADYFAIVIGLVLANQFVLARTPAAAPFALHRVALPGTLWRLLAITAVVACSTTVVSLLDGWIIDARALGIWRLTLSALITVVLAQFAQALLARSRPAAETDPASDLPLVTINSVALGLTLLLNVDELSPARGLLYGAGTGLTFAAITAMSGSVSMRLEAADVPRAWRGAAISLITAGMLSLALLGLSGIVRN